MDRNADVRPKSTNADYVEIDLQFRNEVHVSENTLLTRPLLQVAALCEKHLIEPDGAISLIRIIDRFVLNGTEQTMPVARLSFTLAIMFKSGPFRGKLPLSIQPINPSHINMPETRMDVLFEGDDERGVNLIGQVILEVNEEGLYWIIVNLLDEVYARIPFRVVYQRNPTVLTGS